MIASCWHGIACPSPPMPSNYLLFLLFLLFWGVVVSRHAHGAACDRQATRLVSISSRMASEMSAHRAPDRNGCVSLSSASSHCDVSSGASNDLANIHGGKRATVPPVPPGVEHAFYWNEPPLLTPPSPGLKLV